MNSTTIILIAAGALLIILAVMMIAGQKTEDRITPPEPTPAKRPEPEAPTEMLSPDVSQAVAAEPKQKAKPRRTKAS